MYVALRCGLKYSEIGTSLPATAGTAVMSIECKYSRRPTKHIGSGCLVDRRGKRERLDSPMHCRYYAAVGKEVGALKPNSITLSCSQTGPRLVADVQRAGIWPIIQLASSELAQTSRSATGLRPASDLSATRIA